MSNLRFQPISELLKDSEQIDMYYRCFRAIRDEGEELRRAEFGPEAFAKEVKRYSTQPSATEFALIKNDQYCGFIAFQVEAFGGPEQHAYAFVQTLRNTFSAEELLEPVSRILIEQLEHFKLDYFLTYSKNPVFHQMLKIWRAKLVNQVQVMDLERVGVDEAMLQKWTSTDLGKFGLKTQWFGYIPEEKLKSKAEVATRWLNEIPRQEGSTPYIETEDSLREQQETLAKHGEQLHHLFLVDQSERFVGMSLLRARPGNPPLLDQWLTAVDKPYRRKGLAQYMKACMVAFATEHYPNWKTIRTDCNSVNQPILALNQKLGYQVVEEMLEHEVRKEMLSSFLGDN